MAAVSSMLNLPQQNDSSHGTYSTILSKLEACLLSVMSTAFVVVVVVIISIIIRMPVFFNPPL